MIVWSITREAPGRINLRRKGGNCFEWKKKKSLEDAKEWPDSFPTYQQKSHWKAWIVKTSGWLTNPHLNKVRKGQRNIPLSVLVEYLLFMLKASWSCLRVQQRPSYWTEAKEGSFSVIKSELPHMHTKRLSIYIAMHWRRWNDFVGKFLLTTMCRDKICWSSDTFLLPFTFLHPWISINGRFFRLELSFPSLPKFPKSWF